MVQSSEDWSSRDFRRGGVCSVVLKDVVDKLEK